MAENSKIEWTDHTFNAIIGCTKVSPGCQFCYAERDMDLRLNRAAWGPDGTRTLTADANWKLPIAWNRMAGQNGERYRVFTASLSDVFEDWGGPIHNHKGEQLYMPHIPGGQFLVRQESHDSRLGRPVNMNDVRARLFNIIDNTPNLDWLVLTKRPENIRKMWPEKFLMSGGFTGLHKDKRPNVMLGTSVENQKYANERIPHLLDCKDLARGIFLSAEPLLGPIDLRKVKTHEGHDDVLFVGNEGGHEYAGSPRNFIDWVIVGGESGPDARPMRPDWASSIRDQCQAADVAFMFKQWGEWAPYDKSNHGKFQNADTHAFDEESVVYRVGKKQAGRLLDEVQHDGFPRCL